MPPEAEALLRCPIPRWCRLLFGWCRSTVPMPCCSGWEKARVVQTLSFVAGINHVGAHDPAPRAQNLMPLCRFRAPPLNSSDSVVSCATPGTQRSSISTHSTYERAPRSAATITVLLLCKRTYSENGYNGTAADGSVGGRWISFSAADRRVAALTRELLDGALQWCDEGKRLHGRVGGSGRWLSSAQPTMTPA